MLTIRVDKQITGDTSSAQVALNRQQRRCDNAAVTIFALIQNPTNMQFVQPSSANSFWSSQVSNRPR